MPAPIEKITNWRDSRIDEIIDVRSPSEFADDHIPGAINLPVFSDEERAYIGTIYKQDSPFKARREGAALVSQNVARHIQESLIDRPENWRPLIHCWRGGQRSRAFAHICGEIGWASFLLDGGYKSYRNAILDTLKQDLSHLQICIISGATGSGKTHLLHALQRNGAQILDLEGLANHKGSLLGAVPDSPQPSQRFFESQLVEAINHLELSKTVFIEAESSRVGEISVPKTLWHAMASAQMVELSTPTPIRLALLKADYCHLMRPDSPDLHKLINGMSARHGYEVTNHWQNELETQNYDNFIEALLTDHYDPAYRKASLRHDRIKMGIVHLDGADEMAFNRCAKSVLSLHETQLS